MNHGYAENCPDPATINDHFLTQNKYGNSSYRDNSSLILLATIIKKFDIKSVHSVLDVGAGYGAFAFNAIKSGVSKIYINDLTIENIKCIQSSLKSLDLKNTSIQYLHGDINKKSVFENKYWDQQLRMMERIKKKADSDDIKDENSLNQMIGKEFSQTPFTLRQFHCSISTYLLTLRTQSCLTVKSH